MTHAEYVAEVSNEHRRELLRRLRLEGIKAAHLPEDELPELMWRTFGDRGEHGRDHEVRSR